MWFKGSMCFEEHTDSRVSSTQHVASSVPVALLKCVLICRNVCPPLIIALRCYSICYLFCGFSETILLREALAVDLIDPCGHQKTDCGWFSHMPLLILERLRKLKPIACRTYSQAAYNRQVHQDDFACLFVSLSLSLPLFLSPLCLFSP